MVQSNNISLQPVPVEIDLQNPHFYRFLSNMADSIADELRNPLTGIAGSISMLKEDVKEVIDEEQLDMIDSCIKRMDSFIEDLYLLTQPIDPSFLKLDLTSFVTQVLEQYFMDKNLTYTYSHEKPPVYVNADMILLQTAITNVLENSVEAMEDKGQINVTVQYEESLFPQHVFINILDSGPGIDKKIMGQMFMPFFTTKHNKRGLGLVIARNYLMLHKGDLFIESEKELGTRVKIKLPIFPGSL